MTTPLDTNPYVTVGGTNNNPVTTIGYDQGQYLGNPAGRRTRGLVWRTTTVNEAVNNYVANFGAGGATVQAINQALLQSGMVRRGATIAQFSSAYEKALTLTSKMIAGGNAKATVFDAIGMLSSATTGGGSGSQRATYRDFASYTTAQIQDKATSAYQSVLGRPPTADEITAFGKALKAGAKAAPSVTKVSASGKTRKTTQGFDENAFIAGYMANHIPTALQDLNGEAGALQDFISSFKTNYGVTPTQSFIDNAIKTVIGAADKQGAQDNLAQQLKEQAQVLFPALKDKIDAGMTVRAIADPFISTWSKLREVNDMNVDLNNKDIKSALSQKNDKGEYELMSMDAFAKQIRSSQEWLNTNNAKETLLGAADSLLQQFGFKR